MFCPHRILAAALITDALTKGCRLDELLQLSATRFEALVVDELQDQQPTGHKVGIQVQQLLPVRLLDPHTSQALQRVNCGQRTLPSTAGMDGYPLLQLPSFRFERRRKE